MDRPSLAPPDDEGVREGLAYTLWVPAGEVAGGVVVLHGAGSSKERHHPFARACRAAGLAAVVFDQRGHGESEGALDGRAVSDVLTVAELLPEGAPRALRGSSMGGYLSLVAAAPLGAAAVVAICPASATGLRRGLREGSFDFRADSPALDAFLTEHDEALAMSALEAPVLLLHAEGDDRVPVEHSRELATRFRAEGSRLVTVPGGHHRSIQADGDMEAFSVRWLRRTLRAAG
jgi:alpha-beta hydrolase superfamily lysophospholipase